MEQEHVLKTLKAQLNYGKVINFTRSYFLLPYCSANLNSDSRSHTMRHGGMGKRAYALNHDEVLLEDDSLHGVKTDTTKIIHSKNL
jgi:hypothetical protein